MPRTSPAKKKGVDEMKDRYTPKTERFPIRITGEEKKILYKVARSQGHRGIGGYVTEVALKDAKEKLENDYTKIKQESKK